MKSKYSFLMYLGMTILGGIIGGVLLLYLSTNYFGSADALVFWIGFGFGSLFGLGSIIYEFIYGKWSNTKLYKFLFPSFKSKDPFWGQGNERVERKKLEEKDDYMNLDWLKYQYYDLKRSIQDIADEQGVSMITIRKWIEKIEKP